MHLRGAPLKDLSREALDSLVSIPRTLHIITTQVLFKVEMTPSYCFYPFLLVYLNESRKFVLLQSILNSEGLLPFSFIAGVFLIEVSVTNSSIR